MPERAEEKYETMKTTFRIDDGPAEMRIKHLRNRRLEGVRYANLLSWIKNGSITDEKLEWPKYSTLLKSSWVIIRGRVPQVNHQKIYAIKDI